MVLSPYPLSSLISSLTTLPFAFSTLATLASLLFLEFTGYIPAPEPVHELFFSGILGPGSQTTSPSSLSCLSHLVTFS